MLYGENSVVGKGLSYYSTPDATGEIEACCEIKELDLSLRKDRKEFRRMKKNMRRQKRAIRREKKEEEEDDEEL